MHPSLGRGGKGEGHDCVLGICQNVPCRQNIKQTSSTVKDTNIEQACNGMPGLCAHTSMYTVQLYNEYVLYSLVSNFRGSSYS